MGSYQQFCWISNFLQCKLVKGRNATSQPSLMTFVVSSSNISDESRKTSRAVTLHLICTSSVYHRDISFICCDALQGRSFDGLQHDRPAWPRRGGHQITLVKLTFIHIMQIHKGGMMEEFPTLFEWLFLNYTDYLPPKSQLCLITQCIIPLKIKEKNLQHEDKLKFPTITC